MASKAAKFRVVFVRHGESTWNRENRFTGWTDVDLSEAGLEEAKGAGRALAEAKLSFDLCYTSVLKRAIRTANFCLENLDMLWLPVRKEWRLNERHYGALQGLNKSETAAKHGEDQVKIWRRSYAIPPPPLENVNYAELLVGPYAGLSPAEFPKSESLKDTVDRVLPLWLGPMTDDIRSGRNLLVVAHGNSIRALVKYLDNVPEEEIVELNIPTGIPLVYELDENLRPIKHYYLADEKVLGEKMASVANQGKAK
eukprot:ANDGO_08308.mRNA.1 putative phosphoglycerate mutase